MANRNEQLLTVALGASVVMLKPLETLAPRKVAEKSFQRLEVMVMWELPKIKGTLLGGPCNKDPTIYGTILGSLFSETPMCLFGHYPTSCLLCLSARTQKLGFRV